MYKRKGFYDFYQAGKRIDFHHLRMATFVGMLPHMDKRDVKKGIDVIFPDIYGERKEVGWTDERLKRIKEKAKRIKLKNNA
ncbi:hypothetical protein [Flavitalea sp.]|nr:hypothetical protein [Flavitalea sp.]